MRDQSTIRHLSLRTVRTEFGTPFPTTINPQTPLRDLPVAEALYGRYNNGVVSCHTLALTLAAMRRRSWCPTTTRKGNRPHGCSGPLR